MNNFDLRRVVESFFRIVLGAVFCVSGSLKLLAPTAASNLISQIGFLDKHIAPYFVLLLSLIEVVAGISLIADKMTKHIALLATQFLLLSTVIGVMYLSDPIPCGCFGDLIDSQTDSAFLLRNIILLLISLVILKTSSKFNANPME